MSPIRQATGRDFQRATFVESLYTSLKKQAAKAELENEKFLKLAVSYLKDGLIESECIELLMIDGLNREAAEGITSEATNNTELDDKTGDEYAFQFEDTTGKILSSLDLGRTVRAFSEKEAWDKAEELVSNIPDIESESIISVKKIS